jgi:glycosyltransferase involved in cell wall biosynthesis
MQVAAGCDIFALASHYEGLPVAIMEALAVGLPIVATNVGGVPEAVREGIEGLIVPPHRPDLLADAIESLVDDPRRRRQMGRAARQRAHDYDIEAAVRRTEELYLDVCSRPR